ncbi:MAG: enoyl-CoA hydratase, partial [Acidimicrobiaceae bacterium]|nr:enoyl-CoA hydratase [Acidimicrobiaceae bacterium]
VEDGSLEDKYRWEQGFTFEAYLMSDSAEAREAFAEGRDPRFDPPGPAGEAG